MCYYRFRAFELLLMMMFLYTLALLLTFILCDVKEKVCLLTPEEGPCRAQIEMYYFDPKKGNCSTFTWGGCQGNGNRFDSSTECLEFCVTGRGYKNPRPRYCELRFDYGYCFGAFQRYYYDALWKVCKSAMYSGCGGNHNNFYSMEQCENICLLNRPMVTKANKKLPRGGVRKVLIVNPDDATSKRTYGTTISNATRSTKTVPRVEVIMYT